MAVATLTSKGQVTIPAIVRQSCGLTAGSRIDFTILDAQTVIMHTNLPSLDQLFGSLPNNGVHLDIADMDAAIAQAIEESK